MILYCIYNERYYLRAVEWNREEVVIYVQYYTRRALILYNV